MNMFAQIVARHSIKFDHFLKLIYQLLAHIVLTPTQKENFQDAIATRKEMKIPLLPLVALVPVNLVLAATLDLD